MGPRAEWRVGGVEAVGPAWSALETFVATGGHAPGPAVERRGQRPRPRTCGPGRLPACMSRLPVRRRTRSRRALARAEAGPRRGSAGPQVQTRLVRRAAAG